MNLRGKIFILILICFSIFTVNAKELSGEGFGNTLNDAKAFALQDLMSQIQVDVSAVTNSKLESSSAETKSALSKDVSLVSDFSLQSVKYIVSDSSTPEQKKRGKYYCIATISDADKGQCIDRATQVVDEINSLYLKTVSEKDLRALTTLYSMIEERLKDYQSYEITASLLGYKDELPTYYSGINLSLIQIENKKTQEKLLKGGLDGSIKDTSLDGLEEMFLNELWKDQDSSEKANSVKTSFSEGSYSKEYKIGDFGPAGGIIFYDKGTFSNGWRYLEVSSKDISGKFIYGKSGKVNTKSGLGEGRTNTQLINEFSKKSKDTAAYACSSYTEGGYTDWYLPSKEEMEMLYLKLYGKKNFEISKDAYWTSSQLNSSYAYGYSFKKKDYFSDSKQEKYKVRAIRAF